MMPAWWFDWSADDIDTGPFDEPPDMRDMTDREADWALYGPQHEECSCPDCCIRNGIEHTP